MVNLFPNWVVKHVRNPNLWSNSYLKRPVEVFLVSPKMSKLDIKEYLRKLYGLPVTAVHTAIYQGKTRTSSRGTRYKEADYKKAYVYLADENGLQRPRYQPIEEQLTPEAIKAWPSKPGRYVEPPNKGDNKPVVEQ